MAGAETMIFWHIIRSMRNALLFAVTTGLMMAFVGNDSAVGQSYNSLELAGRPAAVIPVEGLNGQNTTLQFGGGETLIYVFAPKTGACVQNEPNIRVLWQARQKQYKFIGLSLRKPGLEAEMKASPLPFPVFIAKDYRDQKLAAYGFGGVPSLYLIDRNSKIARAWGGMLSGPSQADAEKFFGMKLPGPSKSH